MIPGKNGKKLFSFPKMRVKKLNFIGFINGNTGYSVLSRALIKLMENAGMDIRVEDLNNQIIRQFAHLQKKDHKERFQLLHQIPTVRPMCDAYYTVTEFDQPTHCSISTMRNAKLILTESKFCADIFEEFTRAEIHVINYPLDSQFKPEGPIYKFNKPIEDFRFKFLYVFEWIMRKDPYTLIKAFVEEFKPTEDVCLILRCWSKFINPQKVIGQIAKGHNVFWMPDMVDNLPALYRACDCFVSSSWGEGFGHCGLEAMGCGLKTILPDSTGMREYANKKNSLLIPVKETVVGKAFNEIPHLIKPWFVIWKPDKEALKKAMRRAFNNEMKFIKENALKVKDKFSIENSLKQVKEAFDIE